MAILKLEKGKYYSAFLDKKTNNVYIGPKITEKIGMAIVFANNEQFGVFTFSSSTAKAVVSKIDSPYSDKMHRGSGYYKQYHVMFPNKKRGLTHVWYFM